MATERETIIAALIEARDIGDLMPGHEGFAADTILDALARLAGADLSAFTAGGMPEREE